MKKSLFINLNHPFLALKEINKKILEQKSTIENNVHETSTIFKHK
jgi:hypothetical protein